MLSEIYMLRLEAHLRASDAPLAGRNSDTRFVPIKSLAQPEHSFAAGKLPAGTGVRATETGRSARAG